MITKGDVGIDENTTNWLDFPINLLFISYLSQLYDCKNLHLHKVPMRNTDIAFNDTGISLKVSLVGRV